MIPTKGLSGPYSGLVQTFNVLKAHYRRWHQLRVSGMNFRRFRSEWSLSSSHSSLTEVKGQKNQVMGVQTSIEIAFIKAKTYDT